MKWYYYVLLIVCWIIPIMFGSFLLWKCFWNPKYQKVEWLGFPNFSKPYSGVDAGFYGGHPPFDQLTNTNIVIGLREDGVIVWKNVQ